MDFNEELQNVEQRHEREQQYVLEHRYGVEKMLQPLGADKTAGRVRGSSVDTAGQR